MPAEQFEKGRLGIDRVEAVQCQDRAPGAAAHHFELDPLHPQPFGIGVGHRALPPAQLLQATYSLVRRRSETAVRRGAFLPAVREKRQTACVMASAFSNNCLHIMYLRIICGAAWQRNSWRPAAEWQRNWSRSANRLSVLVKRGSRISIGPPARRKGDDRLI